MSLSGKRIVVGITGGIAAYKTIEFIRLLRKSNAEVRVALTPAAAEFVTPLTCYKPFQVMRFLNLYLILKLN